MHISSEFNNELNWWSDHICLGKNQIKQDAFQLEIYSDASKTGCPGWGNFSQGRCTHGWWNSSETDRHINYPEFKAIMLGLKCLAGHLSSGSTLLRVDNTTAISYTNRMGSIQHRIAFISKELWQWREERNLVICILW